MLGTQSSQSKHDSHLPQNLTKKLNNLNSYGKSKVLSFVKEKKLYSEVKFNFDSTFSDLRDKSPNLNEIFNDIERCDVQTISLLDTYLSDQIASPVNKENLNAQFIAEFNHGVLDNFEKVKSAFSIFSINELPIVREYVKDNLNPKEPLPYTDKCTVDQAITYVYLPHYSVEKSSEFLNKLIQVSILVEDSIGSPESMLKAGSAEYFNFIDHMMFEDIQKLEEKFDINSNEITDKIDKVKSSYLEIINFSKNWNYVTDITDQIALLHGKPTYSKDVDDFAEKFITSKYSSEWEQAGLDIFSLIEDVKILAKLPVLGEAKNPVKIMRGGKFNKEQVEQYLSPIPNKTIEILQTKLSHLPKSEEYAEAIKGEGKLGTAGFLLRSIAAMDQPRRWRVGNAGCDEQGKFVPEALIAELKKDAVKNNYDESVTNAVIQIFCLENNLFTT